MVVPRGASAVRPEPQNELHRTHLARVLTPCCCDVSRCTSASLSNHDWLVWYALYLAVVIGNNLYILLASGDMFDREHVEYPWWHELLLGLNHVLATSLFMLPLGLTASDLLADEEKAVVRYACCDHTSACPAWVLVCCFAGCIAPVCCGCVSAS